MSNLSLKDQPTLADFQFYVQEMFRERGFDEDSIEKRFLFLMEECGELAKAARKHANFRLAEDSQTKETAEEAADVLIILLAICNELGIDLEQAFREKEERNKHRTWN